MTFHHNPPRWIQAVLDNAPDGILIEASERVVYANRSYAELLGYRRSTDLVHRPVSDFIADADTERLIRFGQMRLGGQRVPSSYDFAARRSDGTTIRLQASVSVAACGGMPYITTMVRPFLGGPDLSSDAPIAGPHDALSPRERQVMEMLFDGKRPKSIAFDLGLTENTVATHRTRLMQKLGVADVRELFQYALRHKLVDWS